MYKGLWRQSIKSRDRKDAVYSPFAFFVYSFRTPGLSAAFVLWRITSANADHPTHAETDQVGLSVVSSCSLGTFAAAAAVTWNVVTRPG